MVNASSTPIPATVIAGFLGAGKTTLLNRLLQGAHGVRIAAVVNDVGAVDIDARLVKSVHGKVMSLWNGCICCDADADLRLTLLTLLNMDDPPDSIVVEASGVADPLGIAATFRIPELKVRLRLDGIITMVDAEHARDTQLDRQLVHDQIVLGDIVVVNKSDLVDDAHLDSLTAWIVSIVPRARILRAVHADVPLQLLLDIGRSTSLPDAARGHRHGFATWHWHGDAPMGLHEAMQALKSLPPGVFRAKGILWLDEAPGMRVAVHLVGSRINSDVLGPWDSNETRASDIVFIGAPGAMTDERVSDLFKFPATNSGQVSN